MKDKKCIYFIKIIIKVYRRIECMNITPAFSLLINVRKVIVSIVALLIK